MTKNIYFFIGIVVLLLSRINLVAQDVGFTQFNANPLYLNPSLAGNTEFGRIHLNYRNQWPGIGNVFTSYSVSYDQNLPSIKSGVGLLLLNDRQGDGAYNRTLAGGFYAYQLQVSKKNLIRFGIKAAYYQEGLNADKLMFASGNSGSMGSTEFMSQTVNAIDFGAGIGFGFSDTYFIGFSADHLNQPDISFSDGSEYSLDMKFTIHASMTVNATDGRLGSGKRGDVMILPSFLVMQQSVFKQIIAGVYVSKYPLILGGWFRHGFSL